MRRKKNKVGQVFIYLLFAVITPFIYMSFRYAADSVIDSALAVKTAETAETSVTTTITTVVTPEQRKISFRIITDDSFIINDGLHLPSSQDEEAPIADMPPAPAIPVNPETDLDGIIDIVTYGRMTGSDYIDLDPAGQIRNLTGHTAEDISETASELPSFTLKRDGTPEILIYHTHATESFMLTAAERYDTDFPFRSTDNSINMVSIGNVIAEELIAAGYGVIHDTTLYDKDSYNGSYELSRAGVKKILAENPGIKIVLDVHRDALVKSKSEIVAPTATIGGIDTAQVMVVSNCDGDSLKYPIPNWRENLKLASLINSTTESSYPGLMRPLLFDYRQYNQDLSVGSLLIEVGGHGNSAEQARYAGELFGKGLAEALKKITG
jgi:stage II sporulation protein P